MEMDCGIVWEPERCAVMPQYLKGLEGLTEGHVRLHLLREFLHLSVELSIRALDQAVVDTFLDQLRKVQTVPRNPEDVGHGLRRRRTKHGDDFLLIIDFTVEGPSHGAKNRQCVEGHALHQSSLLVLWVTGEVIREIDRLLPA
ncbi:hypothetical protein HG531_002075 [Fusarium graminearum]|nr:hypothetical protein HG531_002075 [Fusarium graminearum]